MNIGLDDKGVWAPAALTVLADLADWFAYGAEAVHDTNPVWPYSYGPCLFTQSASQPWTYVFFWSGVRPDGTLLIPPFKPSTLRALPARVQRLSPSGPLLVPWTIDEAGLAVNVSTVPNNPLVGLTTYYKKYSDTIVDRAPCATRDCAIYTSAGYVSAGYEGACVRPGANAGEATVRVNLFYNGVDDNMGSPTAPVDGQAWQTVDLECLAYVTGGAGRLPLEVWHNTALNDYWTLASAASRATAVSLGYTMVSSVGYVADVAPPAPGASDVAILRVEWT